MARLNYLYIRMNGEYTEYICVFNRKGMDRNIYSILLLHHFFFFTLQLPSLLLCYHYCSVLSDNYLVFTICKCYLMSHQRLQAR